MSFTVRKIREEKQSKTLRKAAVIGTAMLESMVHLYHQVQSRKQAAEKGEKRVQMMKKTMAVLLAGLLILLLLMGTLKMLVRLKAFSLGSMVSAVSSMPGTDKNGFTNVLLLGEGDNDHEGIDLTDTIMIVSLDPAVSGSAVMLSLPRDLYMLSTEKMGKGRINSLYRDYKGQLVRNGTEKTEASAEALKQLSHEIGKILGLELQGVIKLNFSGFEQTVDAIGGIDIVVPEDIVDPEYPGPNYTYETFQIAAGPQHLDGRTALKYARSRHSTSDFSRSARQQQIIVAISEKAKSLGLLTHLGKAAEIMSIAAKNMETTFEARQLLGLAQLGKKIDRNKIISMQLSDANGLFGALTDRGGFLYAPPREEFDGAAVLLPVSIPEFPVTWKQLQSLTKLLTLHRDAMANPPSILILNAGAKEGSARVLGAELYRYGFNVRKTRNFSKAPNPSFDQSWIAVAKETEPQPSLKPSVTLLSSLLGLQTNTDVEETVFGEEHADIVIVLGKDFRYAPLQNLLR